MKLATLLFSGVAVTGLAIFAGCEADVDTASDAPPTNVTIENRYEDRQPDVRYGTPERDQDIRIETRESNDYRFDDADRDMDSDVDIDEDIDIDRDIDRDVDID